MIVKVAKGGADSKCQSYFDRCTSGRLAAPDSAKSPLFFKVLETLRPPILTHGCVGLGGRKK